MKIFNLPDLGEGLPDAEIVEWYVKPGDTVEEGDAIVSMETAKATLDVPAPFSGTVEKLFGEAGDTIDTDTPLIGFEGEAEAKVATVVGKIETEDALSVPEEVMVARPRATSGMNAKALPAVRIYAKKQGVDLSTITGSGPDGMITQSDVDQVLGEKSSSILYTGQKVTLKSAQRAMIRSMVASHQQVVPATIFDDVDIHAWYKQANPTVKVIRAIEKAAQVEPTLNAWFHPQDESLEVFDKVNLGLAIDAGESGLYVPVLKETNDKNDEVIREQITDFKIKISERMLKPEESKGFSIMLSNFGMMAGKYATPVLTPPCVAILATGSITQQPVVDENSQVCAHPVLPLSLTFDHRVITGGMAARFLAVLKEALK